MKMHDRKNRFRWLGLLAVWGFSSSPTSSLGQKRVAHILHLKGKKACQALPTIFPSLVKSQNCFQGQHIEARQCQKSTEAWQNLAQREKILLPSLSKMLHLLQKQQQYYPQMKQIEHFEQQKSSTLPTILPFWKNSRNSLLQALQKHDEQVHSLLTVPSSLPLQYKSPTIFPIQVFNSTSEQAQRALFSSKVQSESKKTLIPPTIPMFQQRYCFGPDFIIQY